MPPRFENDLTGFVARKVLTTRHLANLSFYKNAYREGARSSTHAHENARFVFVLRGRFSEVYARRSRQCTPFMTIFRPPAERHAEDYHGKGIVCISVDVGPAWLEGLRQHNVDLDRSADFRSGALMSLITRLNAEIINQDDVSQLAIEALMLEIAVEVHRQGKSSVAGARNPPWLRVVKDLIHARIDSALTISEIASAAGVHPVHLARVFRRNCGCTVADYIRRSRVEFACTRLASSTESLAEIALRSGFSDQSHFSKTFKRVMNVTPGEYRTAANSR